jgi:hypothetical protein
MQDRWLERIEENEERTREAMQREIWRAQQLQQHRIDGTQGPFGQHTAIALVGQESALRMGAHAAGVVLQALDGRLRRPGEQGL